LLRLNTGSSSEPESSDRYCRDVARAAHGGDPSRIAVLGDPAGADIASNVMLDLADPGKVGMTPSDIAAPNYLSETSTTLM